MYYEEQYPREQSREAQIPNSSQSSMQQSQIQPVYYGWPMGNLYWYQQMLEQQFKRDLDIYQSQQQSQQPLSFQSQEFQPEHMKSSENNEPAALEISNPNLIQMVSSAAAPDSQEDSSDNEQTTNVLKSLVQLRSKYNMGEHASQTMYFDTFNPRDHQYEYENVAQEHSSFENPQQTSYERAERYESRPHHEVESRPHHEHESRPQQGYENRDQQNRVSQKEYESYTYESESTLNHVAQPFEPSQTSESEQSQIPDWSGLSHWNYGMYQMDATYPPMMFNPMTMPTQEPVDQIPGANIPVNPGTVYPVQEPSAQQAPLYSEITQTPPESLSSQSNGSSVMKTIGRPPNFNASSREELLHLFSRKIGLDEKTSSSYADSCFNKGANAEVLENWFYTFWNLKFNNAHRYMMECGFSGETNERFEGLYHLFRTVMEVNSAEAFHLTRTNWREDKNINAKNIGAWFNIFHDTCGLDASEAKNLSLQYKYVQRGQKKFTSLFELFHNKIALKPEQCVLLCRSCFERDDLDTKVIHNSFSYYSSRSKSKMQALANMKKELKIGSPKS